MRHIIVDCNNMCYIQRHAFGDDLSHGQEQTGVMWGFLNAMLSIAERFQSRKFLFAWDAHPPERKRVYPQYKANRHRDVSPETEANVRKQFDLLRTVILPGMGFKNVYRFAGMEADDIVAALVLDYDWAEPPLVVSTDKDLYQLVKHCDIYRPLPGDKKMVITRDGFAELFGVTSDQWVDVRALEGDTGDNLPGVPDVGRKTAIQYVHKKLPLGRRYGNITSPEGQKIFKRNQQLMRLPWPSTPIPTIETNETFDENTFISICRQYGFQSFLQPGNYRKWRDRFGLHCVDSAEAE